MNIEVTNTFIEVISPKEDIRVIALTTDGREVWITIPANTWIKIMTNTEGKFV